MTIWFLLVTAGLGGRGLVELSYGNRAASAAERSLRTSVGLLIGLGIGSSLFGALLLLGRARTSAAWASDLLMLGLALGSYFRHRRIQAPNATLRNGPLPRGWLVLFVLGCAISAFAAFEHTRALPDGGWDAWMVWNQRARFLFRGTIEQAFDTKYGGIHDDYPLLLPGLVAFGWTHLRAESLAWPTALSWTAAVLSVAILLPAVALWRGTVRGLAAGLVLATTPQLVLSAASHEADLWVASFALAGQVVAFQALRGEGAARFKLLALAGCLLGLAGWTKNEGSLFGIALMAALLWPHPQGTSIKRRLVDILALASGAAPLLVLLVSFKLGYAPSNDLLAGDTLAQKLARLGDPMRWVELVLLLLRRVAHFQVWTLGWAAAFVTGIYLWRRGALLDCVGPAVRSLLIVGIGLVLVFAVSPRELNWQITHSADRLLLQCWPSVLFALSIAWPMENPRR